MLHLDIWIANFGCQQKIFSDNDGEFFNETLEEINKKWGLKTKTLQAIRHLAVEQ